MIQPHARRWRTSAGWPRRGARGRTASTRRSTTPPSGCPRAVASVVVRSYMAHHQGMSLVALANAAARRADAPPLPGRADGPGRRAAPAGARARAASRWSSRPRGRDRPPRRRRGGKRPDEPPADTPNTPAPRTHLLSNGNYHVMLTNAGSGYSTCQRAGRDPLARGRHPRLLGAVRATSATSPAGVVWSAGYQPTCRAADEYEVTFSADKVDVPPRSTRRSRP